MIFIKNTTVTLVFLLLVFTSYSQKKFGYGGIYYFSNSNHIKKEYKNILVITNVPFSAYPKILKMANKYHYNVVMASELMPPIKTYTDLEVKDILEKNNIGAIIYYNILSTEVVSANYSYSTYSFPIVAGTSGMITTTRPQKNYVNIELYFVDLEKRNEYAIYAKGWASGATKKVSERCFYVLMKNLDKYNVARPLKE